MSDDSIKISPFGIKVGDIDINWNPFSAVSQIEVCFNGECEIFKCNGGLKLIQNNVVTCDKSVPTRSLMPLTKA